MNTQRKNSLLLLLCAFIWGTAFVAQSAGSGMGACSFLAGRSWLAVLVLLPTVKVFDLVRQRSTGTTGAPKTPEERRCLRRASLVCGTLLFVASAAQQFGLTLNPSTAKAGFLTAMYVVLVPIFGLALGRRGSPQLWLSVAIAVCGLYLLCSATARTAWPWQGSWKPTRRWLTSTTAVWNPAPTMHWPKSTCRTAAAAWSALAWPAAVRQPAPL